MWPWSVLRERRHRRRFNAALVVFLGAHLSARLGPAERARVDAAWRDILRESPETPAAVQRWANWSYVAAYQAAAMQRVGIEPAVAGLTWEHLFRRWSRYNTLFAGRRWTNAQHAFDWRPAMLVSDYYPMDPATSEAKAWLREHGVAVPDSDPWGLGTVNSIDGVIDGVGVEALRRHWRLEEERRRSA